ncbi:hypothetical protein ACFOET_11020 [Parapedobacter deserti]|uniref:TonB C-terminal domain-containing protein n=1 Tax=Parapedobacter deserti TaxID=1912957 RepID=A0ABV7JM20_9SPHI
MKNFLKLLGITIINILLCLTVSAQQKFTEGKMIVDEISFEVSFPKTESIVVSSRLPKYKDGYPLPQSPTPPLPIRRGDMEVDTLIDRKIIYEALKEKLDKLKANSEKITIRYVFGQDGNVLDISSYSLPKNTLTPKELAVIDKRLRKEVKATFKGREYLEHPVIFYGREIRF